MLKLDPPRPSAQALRPLDPTATRARHNNAQKTRGKRETS